MSVMLDMGGKPTDSLPYFENAPFVAVAGGSGFIGSHVIQALLDHGHKIVCITRGQRRSGLNDSLIFNNNLIYLDYDLSSPSLTHAIIEALRNCIAVVNLVGIKVERDDQTFERVHIGVVKQLLEISRKIQAKRFVHISVQCARRDAIHAYQDTKFRSEELIKASGVPYTILRPSVVYGKGDDMISSLAGVIRTSPLFPLIGNGSFLHQPIMVTDLAACVVECLNSDNALGKVYEIVGPTKVTIKEMVHIVADGMGLPTWSFAFPVFFHRIAAELGSKVMQNPPATPAQLTMLIEGMTGDSSQIRHDLDMPKLCTTVLAPNLIQQFESQIPPIAGFSLRLLSSQAHYAWLETHLPLIKKSTLLSLLSLFLGFASLSFDPVVGLFLTYLIIGAALVILMRPHLRWRIAMIQPPPPNVRLYHAALGLVFALCLCIFVKFFLPLSPTDWSLAAKKFRNFKFSIFVFFAGIPTDEILWSACVLPVLAKIACGRKRGGEKGEEKGEKEEKGERESIEEIDDANAAVNRRLGYSVLFVFSLIYGTWLSFLLRVSLLAPNYAFALLGLVGFGAGVLVIKTEKLVAGVVFKAFLWLVMLFWME